MAKLRALKVLSIGLATAGLSLCWCLPQRTAQAVSPKNAATGRGGASVDSNKGSSLTNPLHNEGAPDGIFPDAAKAAQSGPGGTIPSLARVGEGATSADVKINGFPVESLGILKVEDNEPFETDYRTIAPIHPYFLNPGENQLHTVGGEGGAIAIVRWDYVGGSEHEELLRSALPAKRDQPFSWNAKVPKRSWTTGVKIPANDATKRRVYAETAGLHSKLQALAAAAAQNEQTRDTAMTLKKKWLDSTHEFVEASKLRGKPYRLIDQILEAATVRALPDKPAGSLELKPLEPADGLELEVFAGGTLAKVKPAGGVPLFTYVSNLPDGPRGRTGTAKLAFDAWYRLNSKGAWELDALYPRLAPGTWTQFEQGPYHLEDLFRLSNF